MSTETDNQTKIRLEVSRWGGIAYRNNSGVAFREDGVPVRFGLGNDSAKINKIRASSDLICCLPVTITPEMVGHIVGVMLVIETKKTGWKFLKSNKRSVAQLNFINQIRKLFGIGCFASSVDDVKIAIQQWYERFKK